MSSVHIVVTDGYTLNPGDNPWDDLEALGQLTVHDRTSDAELTGRCRGADVLVVNKTQIRKADLAELDRLRLIAVSATGYDCVDVEEAGKKGVPVCNVPIYGTDSVAQYVISAILHTWQNLGLHDAAVRSGEWSRQPDWSFWKAPLVELRDLTIGIVGFGRIGRRVGELANAFGMQVLAHDPFVGAPPAYDRFEWAGLGDLFARSDVVTLHTPLTSGNNGFVNHSLLSKMKPAALLINAARGPLVNEQDLADALNAGGLAAAVVDTVSNEPIRPENPLLSARNILITPHLAWATLAARRRLMSQTVANIEAFLDGRPQNVVNTDFLVTR